MSSFEFELERDISFIFLIMKQGPLGKWFLWF